MLCIKYGQHDLPPAGIPPREVVTLHAGAQPGQHAVACAPRLPPSCRAARACLPALLVSGLLRGKASKEIQELLGQLLRRGKQEAVVLVGDELSDAAIVEGADGQAAAKHVHNLRSCVCGKQLPGVSQLTCWVQDAVCLVQSPLHANAKKTRTTLMPQRQQHM